MEILPFWFRNIYTRFQNELFYLFIAFVSIVFFFLNREKFKWYPAISISFLFNFAVSLLFFFLTKKFVYLSLSMAFISISLFILLLVNNPFFRKIMGVFLIWGTLFVVLLKFIAYRFVDNELLFVLFYSIGLLLFSDKTKKYVYLSLLTALVKITLAAKLFIWFFISLWAVLEAVENRISKKVFIVVLIASFFISFIGYEKPKLQLSYSFDLTFKNIVAGLKNILPIKQEKVFEENYMENQTKAVVKVPDLKLAQILMNPYPKSPSFVEEIIYYFGILSLFMFGSLFIFMRKRLALLLVPLLFVFNLYPLPMFLLMSFLFYKTSPKYYWSEEKNVLFHPAFAYALIVLIQAYFVWDVYNNLRFARWFSDYKIAKNLWNKYKLYPALELYTYFGGFENKKEFLNVDVNKHYLYKRGKAINLYLSNKLKEAKKITDDYLRNYNPQDPYMLAIMGLINMVEKKSTAEVNKGFALLNKALDIYKFCRIGLYQRGKILFMNKKRKEAQRDLINLLMYHNNCFDADRVLDVSLTKEDLDYKGKNNEKNAK